MDVDGESLVRRESEAVEEENADLADLIVGLAHEGVHVEDPVEGVDLGEGGDVHWEAPVGEDHPEHGEGEEGFRVFEVSSIEIFDRFDFEFGGNGGLGLCFGYVLCLRRSAK